jgi:hypothetical protein
MWIFWLVFNTLLFSLGTINLACSIRYNENAWVNDREYPGGPFNYLVEQGSLPFATLGNVASILASFMSDGMLVSVISQITTPRVNDLTAVPCRGSVGFRMVHRGAPRSVFHCMYQ